MATAVCLHCTQNERRPLAAGLTKYGLIELSLSILNLIRILLSDSWQTE